MKTTSTFILTAATFLIGLSSSAQNAILSPKLEKVWTVAEGLNVPESACYNESGNTIYVSNIVGMHNIKDGIGYISKLTKKENLSKKNGCKV